MTSTACANDSPLEGAQLSNQVMRGARKARRAKAELMPQAKPPRIPRLDTLEGWMKEIGNLYRGARRGELPVDDAARLAFIANAGSKIVTTLAELQNDAQLRVDWAAHEAKQAALGHPDPDEDGADAAFARQASVVAGSDADSDVEPQP